MCLYSFICYVLHIVIVLLYKLLKLVNLNDLVVHQKKSKFKRTTSSIKENKSLKSSKQPSLASPRVKINSNKNKSNSNKRKKKNKGFLGLW